MKVDLSVVIPVYNEEKRFYPLLKPVVQYLEEHFANFELIIVNDGSLDQTESVIQKSITGNKNVKLISYYPNRGKGYAIRQGILSSRGQRVLFMDADLSTPLDQIPKILSQLERSDIVIGSRGIAAADIRQKPPLFRRFASFVFDQIKFIMVGLREFKDTQCGFKAFKGDIARSLFAKSKIDRFMFDAEILYMAQKQGLKINEIPVVWSDAPESKVRFLPGLIQMFRDLWRIRYT